MNDSPKFSTYDIEYAHLLYFVTRCFLFTLGRGNQSKKNVIPTLKMSMLRYSHELETGYTQKT